MPSVVDFQSLGGRAKEQEQQRRSGGGGKNDGTRPEWLKVNGDEKIRPIGQAMEIIKLFVDVNGQVRSCVVSASDKNEAVVQIAEKVGEDNVSARSRFVMNVIHREDAHIKIMEGGMQIFGTFGKWNNSMNIHPGSKDGYNWEISCESTGPDARNKKYTAIPLDPAPLTEDEKNLIREKKKLYTLEDVYKPTPLDEVMDRIFGERKKGPAPESAPQKESTSDKDEDFDW